MLIGRLSVYRSPWDRLLIKYGKVYLPHGFRRPKAWHLYHIRAVELSVKVTLKSVLSSSICVFLLKFHDKILSKLSIKTIDIDSKTWENTVGQSWLSSHPVGLTKSPSIFWILQHHRVLWTYQSAEVGGSSLHLQLASSSGNGNFIQ